MPEILVINAGSSSIKVSLFDRVGDEPRLKLNAHVEGIGTDHLKVTGVERLHAATAAAATWVAVQAVERCLRAHQAQLPAAPSPVCS